MEKSDNEIQGNPCYQPDNEIINELKTRNLDRILEILWDGQFDKSEFDELVSILIKETWYFDTSEKFLANWYFILVKKLFESSSDKSKKLFKRYLIENPEIDPILLLALLDNLFDYDNYKQARALDYQWGAPQPLIERIRKRMKGGWKY
ncbi:MAG: hypothetical protein ACD_2C00065G0002 [uncultured bacterium (gcode 4)]|uniref:Uncharacterized protein n=1 Tax=uncultured bacterium (gcode 4) TaxID=1234023 RepID=K2FFN2_9BACT|nr:MAG: hypothetical protein ACD_2C00065G0002 [uncultured bacterium (gcode 4)]